MKLNRDHIDYIIKDLNYRGMVADEIQDELIDHICIAEGDGKKFIDVYTEAPVNPSKQQQTITSIL